MSRTPVHPPVLVQGVVSGWVAEDAVLPAVPADSDLGVADGADGVWVVLAARAIVDAAIGRGSTGLRPGAGAVDPDRRKRHVSRAPSQRRASEPFSWRRLAARASDTGLNGNFEL